MKVAVLGDIHGNSLALDAVLSQIRKENIQHLLITGDLVGYYYHPERVMKALDEFSSDMVKGNHEHMFETISQGDTGLSQLYLEKYGTSLQHTDRVLDQGQRDALFLLPQKKEFQLSGRKILLCHGSPWKYDEYVYPDTLDDRFSVFADEGFDVVIMGHTHYPMIKSISQTLFINPGSVGQPRDHNPGASWSTLDLETLGFTLKHTDYDVQQIVNEVRENDPHLSYNADVLTRTTEK